ncbi:MAG: hypothetical protein ABI835_01345 [Chloroflexota bacterium]
MEETQKFLRQFASDTRYCFELFRRAYGDLLEEALSRIYDIYLPMLARHARRHPLYFQSCQDDDYFARVALSSFYRVNRGTRFEEKFSVLPGVINYLYACLHSAIAEDVRENARLVESPSDDPDFPSAAPPADPDLQDAPALWAHVISLLPEAEHQRLAYLRFVLAMKPAEIVQQYPQSWATEREVSVALQLIRRRLRKDDHLRDQAGFGDGSDEDE